MTLIKSIFAAAAVLTALTGSAAFARDTTPAVPACCAKGNCCAAGVCCTMPGCCKADKSCCDPAKGVCTSACGCLTMHCCGGGGGSAKSTKSAKPGKRATVKTAPAACCVKK